MAIPRQINDGNWNIPAIQGIEYSFPFSDKGDGSTFKAQCLKYADKNSYRALAPMSTMQFPYGLGYLTKLGETRDIGSGIYEFTDEYSSLPINRTEFGNFAFTSQWFKGATESGVDPNKYFYEVSFDLEEQTFTVPCQYLYEYFLFQQPQPILKQRAYLLFGQMFEIQGGTFNGLICAEDSQIKIYGGKIYERRTPFVSPIGGNPVV